MPSRKKKSTKPPPAKRALLYKVVELSNVDEHALERTVNEWVSRGWTFDGVQFAMRESSKRPSMGFVFFTREGAAIEEHEAPSLSEEQGYRSDEEAERQLKRLILGDQQVPAQGQQDAWARLKEMAGDSDDSAEGDS